MDIVSEKIVDARSQRIDRFGETLLRQNRLNGTPCLDIAIRELEISRSFDSVGELADSVNKVDSSIGLHKP
jgi:hypothetical protein